MHPILFTVGDFRIYTYGLTMAVAFVIGFGWVFHEARRLGEDLDDYYNLCLISLIGGIFGSRLLYIIVNWGSYKEDYWKIFNLREGGLVWYGGVIAVVFLFWVYTRMKGMNFYHVSDIYVAPVAVGLGVGRLGCLMSGCCYGRPTDVAWSIMYPQGELLPADLIGVRVHPSPVYELLAALAIAGLVAYLQRRKTYLGQPTWVFFMTYGIARYVLEIFRGDELRGWVIEGTLSTSQFISVPLVLFSAFMLTRLKEPPPEQVEEE